MNIFLKLYLNYNISPFYFSSPWFTFNNHFIYLFIPCIFIVFIHHYFPPTASPPPSSSQCHVLWVCCCLCFDWLGWVGFRCVLSCVLVLGNSHSLISVAHMHISVSLSIETWSTYWQPCPPRRWLCLLQQPSTTGSSSSTKAGASRTPPFGLWPAWYCLSLMQVSQPLRADSRCVYDNLSLHSSSSADSCSLHTHSSRTAHELCAEACEYRQFFQSQALLMTSICIQLLWLLLTASEWFCFRQLKSGNQFPSTSSCK